MSDDEVNRQSQDVSATRFPNWPTIPNRPANPLIILLFKGLVSFAYNPGERWCEIGFNKGDGKHQLKITTTDPIPIDPSKIRNMSLGILTNGQAKSPQVFFLNQGSEKDFSKVLDLNSTEFYPGERPKLHFPTKLLVKHGTFHVSRLTFYAFDRVTIRAEPIFQPTARMPLGHVGRDVMVEIELAINEQVAFIVDGSEVARLPRNPGQPYTIEFDNQCIENLRQCEFNHNSLFETRRSDFHFHRKVLSLPSETIRFGLLLTEGQLTNDGFDKITKRKPDGTDLAPCMGVGYGDAGGLP